MILVYGDALPHPPIRGVVAKTRGCLQRESSYSAMRTSRSMATAKLKLEEVADLRVGPCLIVRVAACQVARMFSTETPHVPQPA